MTERESLFKKLHSYAETDYYPYHMPGHKRRQLGELPEQLVRTDITEIDGFDDLHNPQGILARLQEKANRLYGVDETFYMVNGSTGGILSAISAALPAGGHLLMARDCHKSAYHAVYLRRLRVTYLYAERVEGFAFHEAVTADQVDRALSREPDIGAVLIVSPTYEGRIADIEAIAETVHRRGIPLIVDEAHGAHLGFAKGFAPGSCAQGADLVIHSVHKTLPALTQTALLHVNGERIDRELLKRFLHIYQSSSPSYLLMAGISDAMEIVERRGEELFAKFREQYRSLTEHLEVCQSLRFVPWQDVEQGRQDIGKLVIATDRSNVSGQWLYDALREDYHLQCEMAAGDHCLAMFTLADEGEAYDRMERALLELDARLTERAMPERTMAGRTMSEREMPECAVSERTVTEHGRTIQEKLEKHFPQIVCPLADAWDRPWKTTDVSCAAGCVAAEFVSLYPPGIPLLVPGEVFTEELREQIAEYLSRGLRIQGLEERDGRYFIRVIKEPL
ncbi:MAG: aminotransferase class I/II-fold pyridoxal phosphate-dependent enzyme [Acetatifactor muris]|nr:aminotransferase class I/II-fold pyridoxal phosphate-dependent enzyme [Acetatifactor muris]MCM1526677.1 aminotransferase class I/II-fold pyridoxal phosphate-dependent enzyme [Bacteroides sp.]